MRYMPTQIKEALDISEETLRHWRKHLAPLAGKRGYAPCFSPGDLLSLKVVVQFQALGVSVGHLKPFASELFRLCSRGAWFFLEDKVLVFDGKTLALVLSGVEAELKAANAQIVIPLAPLVRQLRLRLSEDEVKPSQAELVFPPLSVAQARHL